MPRSALVPPATDPTPIFEHFRGSYGTELLTAAVAHLGVFEALAKPMPLADLREVIGLAERPANVLVTALRAMGLLEVDDGGRLAATPLAREHLPAEADFGVGGYLGLAAQSPGVVEMVERLRSNRPAGSGRDQDGAAFIFREGIESAMESEASARSLTLALAGRAKNVAPHLAKVAPLADRSHLLDVGGGTGIYAIACLQAHPHLRASVWDRPEVLKVAREMAEIHGVIDRLELLPGDMFADAVPVGADAILLSNILHDWDLPECRSLVGRLAEAMPPGGRLMIHDVFLDDDLGGPLPIALYSAALFTLTEGRAYSAAEFRGWMEETGLHVGAKVDTLIHCGLLTGQR
jgi:O-methyltransferase domain